MDPEVNITELCNLSYLWADVLWASAQASNLKKLTKANKKDTNPFIPHNIYVPKLLRYIHKDIVYEVKLFKTLRFYSVFNELIILLH